MFKPCGHFSVLTLHDLSVAFDTVVGVELSLLGFKVPYYPDFLSLWASFAFLLISSLLTFAGPGLSILRLLLFL